MMTKVLIIDGPVRGEVRDFGDARSLAYAKEPALPPYALASPDTDIEPEYGVYQVHKYFIGGRVIRVASCEPGLPPEAVIDAAIWDYLMSDMAKELAELIPSLGSLR